MPSGSRFRRCFACLVRGSGVPSDPVASPKRVQEHPCGPHAAARGTPTSSRVATAIDLLRSRERGVPRYNQFRRLFHKKPVTSFEELTDNPQWAQEIKHVYGGDLEKVDLLVGLMCEPLPEGFGFSDTALRVFILMASRRLKSDRFLSADYLPEFYTQAGIEWVEETTMLDVLRQHVPALAPVLQGVNNAFQPWKTVA